MMQDTDRVGRIEGIFRETEFLRIALQKPDGYIVRPALIYFALSGDFLGFRS